MTATALLCHTIAAQTQIYGCICFNFSKAILVLILITLDN